MRRTRLTGAGRPRRLVALPTAEPTVPLQGTEEWLSTLDDPHDTTVHEPQASSDEVLLEQDGDVEP